MTSGIIQAQYDELDAVAARFGRQAEASAALRGQVLRGVEALEDGGWEGRGAAAFFSETSSILLPALQRLQEALGEAQAVTLDISALLRAAEEEAAALFSGERPSINIGANIGVASKGAGRMEGAGGDSVSVGVQTSGPDIRVIRESNLGFPYAVEGELAAAQVYGNTNLGSVPVTGSAKAALGAFGAGLKLGLGEQGLPTAGVYAEGSVARASVEGVIGNENFGATGGAEVKALGVEGFAGIEDGSFTAQAGATLVSARAETGTNIAGVNVGVSGEVGLKWEVGVKLGPETEVKLPFVSFGISFGKAKDGKQ